MSQATFDTLQYYEKLKSAGVPEQQAKVQVEVMQSVVNSYDAATRKELATKGNIQDVRNELQDVRNELQKEIQDVRTELKTEIADTKHEILKWVLSIALAQTAVIIAVIGVAVALLLR